jgi:integrase
LKAINWFAVQVRTGAPLSPSELRTRAFPKSPASRRFATDFASLTPHELRAVVGSASGSLRLLLLAGALTGARLGDIATMRWADLDLAAGTWTFTPMKTSRTGKRLVLPLLSPLLDELRAAQAEALLPRRQDAVRPILIGPSPVPVGLRPPSTGGGQLAVNQQPTTNT